MTKTGHIISLILLVVVVAILAAIGFVAYSIAHDVGHHTKKKLERKNVSFTRQGMKVGVKEVTREQQEDATQRYSLFPFCLSETRTQLLTFSQCAHEDLEHLRMAGV